MRLMIVVKIEKRKKKGDDCAFVKQEKESE